MENELMYKSVKMDLAFRQKQNAIYTLTASYTCRLVVTYVPLSCWICLFVYLFVCLF